MADKNETPWNEEKTLFLIDAYRVREILWNPKDKNYYKQHLKKEAWAEIANLMSVPVAKCNSKIISVLSSYRRERLKERRSRENGDGTTGIYTSRWFAFEALKFLDERGILRRRKREMEDPLEFSGAENSSDQDSLPDFPPASPSEHAPQEAKLIRRDENNVLKHEIELLVPTAQQIENSTSIAEVTKSFMSFIGAKLNSYSPRSRTLVEHAILEIIMKADMGCYEKYEQ